MSDTVEPLADQVHRLAVDMQAALGGHPLAARCGEVADRLDGPLRVAIAGRVKAGKSTLLNALLGEQLAPTDAGECTTIATWYRHGADYAVGAVLTDGTRQALTFRRTDGSLDVDLGGCPPERVERLEVTVPSASLARMVLVDTPGLASINDQNSVRTEQLLAGGGDRPEGEADAVIYLMRHVHQRDIRYLEAFMDRTVALGTPLNALGLLSRADEIGVGRVDALQSARRIAERYRIEPQLRSLVGTVVPVVGLLAETAATLREDEVATLRRLAALDPAERDALLVTADRFRDVHRTDVTAEVRAELLGRLGMFGVRFVIGRLAASPAMTAADLARELVEASGVAEVRRQIADRFLPRARVLQARSAIAALRSVAAALAADDPGIAAELVARLERIEASALDFARLRVLHLASSGLVHLSADQVEELRSLAAGERVPQRAAVMVALERWHERREDPLCDASRAELCDHAIRLYEAAYAS